MRLSAWQLRREHTLSDRGRRRVAAALASQAKTLYSEDLQPGLLMRETLKIVNPFKIPPAPKRCAGLVGTGFPAIGGWLSLTEWLCQGVSLEDGRAMRTPAALSKTVRSLLAMKTKCRGKL